MEEQLDRFQAKLESINTIYANKFKEIGFMQGFEIIGTCIKNGVPVGMASPKLVYGWLDPNSGLEINQGWLLFAIKGHFFEVRIKQKAYPEEGDHPQVRADKQAFDFKELQERIKCGDYDEMFNEETDKTVTEDLLDLIKKHNLVL